MAPGLPVQKFWDHVADGALSGDHLGELVVDLSVFGDGLALGEILGAEARFEGIAGVGNSRRQTGRCRCALVTAAISVDHRRKMNLQNCLITVENLAAGR